MPPQRQPDLAPPSSLFEAVRDRGATLRDRYRGDPEGLAERLGLKLPRKPVQVMKELGVYDPARHGPDVPGLRDLVIDVCMKRTRNAVAVGPRGGGKSQGVSFIEFYLWIIELYDALNLGGSELQANNVYEYLLSYLDSDPYWSTLLKGDPKVSETWTKDDAWIRVLTASSKSVRSPHAGGWKRRAQRWAGGLLVIDEEAEADRDIVESALPTVNTARPSVNVRCSTFHNVGGTFEEVVDNHEEMGYDMYRWDALDIAEPCGCPGGAAECHAEEKCFREDHVDEYFDPESGEIKQKLIHRAYCGGRMKYAEGWMPKDEIFSIWKRWRRNHSRFEVEMMGSRPGTSGHVIKDRAAYLRNKLDLTPISLYKPGFPIEICVDWGTVAAGLTVWQDQSDATVDADGKRHPFDKHVLLHADLIEEAGLTQIIAKILEYWNRYPEARTVAADIGGGGNYLNPHLREEHRIPCRDVNFGEEKEGAVAAWNIFNESDAVMYFTDHTEFDTQIRNWKRKNGKIAKGDDHLMDSSVCYFARFIEQLGLQNVKAVTRSFSSEVGGPSQPIVKESSGAVATRGRRVTLVRAIGRRR